MYTTNNNTMQWYINKLQREGIQEGFINVGGINDSQLSLPSGIYSLA